MNSKFDSKTLVRASLLVALSVVLTRVGSIKILPSIRFGLGEVPLIISGILLGPYIGACTGLIADLIGFLIDTTGMPFHPGFTLSSVLWGLIPGIITYILVDRLSVENISDTKNIFFIVLVSRLIISIGLNTYWLTSLLGEGYFVLLTERAMTSLVQIPIETIVISKLVRNLDRVKNYN